MIFLVSILLTLVANLISAIFYTTFFSNKHLAVSVWRQASSISISLWFLIVYHRLLQNNCEQKHKHQFIRLIFFFYLWVNLYSQMNSLLPWRNPWGSGTSELETTRPWLTQACISGFLLPFSFIFYILRVFVIWRF